MLLKKSDYKNSKFVVDALENVNAYKDKEKNVIPLLKIFRSILLPKCFPVSACIIFKNGVIL